MTSGPLTNCERLRDAFENREAVYLERGALRVRVSNIRANVVVQAISADLEEIPVTKILHVNWPRQADGSWRFVIDNPGGTA
jgi:hypothetical protein